MELNRSFYYKLSQECSRSKELRQLIIKLSEAQPRYGYRRIAALLSRLGHDVNPKRVQGIRRQEGLRVLKRQRKTRRVNPHTPERKRATEPNEVWSWDFVHDMTEQGNRFRV